MSEDFVAASVRQEAAESDYERASRLIRAWHAYLGQAAKPLPVSPGVDDNVRINLSGTLVDKGVSWLFGADRALSLDDDDESGEELDELWLPERRALTLHQLGVNGGVCGHTFARLRSDGRVIVWDPSNVEVAHEDDDVEEAFEFTNTWAVIDREGNPYARRQRVFKESDSLWTILDETSEESGGSWETVNQETWARDFPPVYHCQNLPMPNEFYGRADLELDVLDLIESIEALAGYGRKLVRQQGAQVPWVTGESAERIRQLDVTLGKLLAIPDKDAKVGQLSAATPEGIEWLYSKAWEAFHYVTRTPPIAFGIVNMSNVAEETVELAYSPAVEKTWDKRLTYGPMLTDLSAAILELGGTRGVRPKPQWSSIIPRSEKSETEALEADRRMKVVSRQTVAEKRGYQWDVEQERMSQEAEASAEAMATAFDQGRTEGEEDDDAGPFGGGLDAS